MGKLRAWRYIKNNKKRASILIISLGLYIALLYGVRFFINPMYYTDESVFLGNSNLMQMARINRGDKIPMDTSLVNENSNATNEEKINEINRAFRVYAKELEKDDRIDHVFLCYTYGITLHSSGGSTNYSVPMVTKEELRLICDHMGVQLIGGTYPQNPGDIIMDERMAKNLGVKLGDTIYDDFTKVCGIVSYDEYFAAGIEYDSLFVKRDLVFLDQGTLTDLREFFLKHGWDASTDDADEIYIIRDVENAKNLVEKYKHSLDQPMTIMFCTITTVMGVVLYFVYQLHIKARYEEWCLFQSLGYSQKEVFSLALREYLICVIGGSILAIILILIIFIVGGGMLDSKGIIYRYWLPETFFQLISIFAFLTAVLQIPVFQAMRHITTIDAIEDDI